MENPKKNYVKIFYFYYWGKPEKSLIIMLKNEKGQMIVEEKDLKRVSMKFYNRIYKALVNTQEIKESKNQLVMFNLGCKVH